MIETIPEVRAIALRIADALEGIRQELRGIHQTTCKHGGATLTVKHPTERNRWLWHCPKCDLVYDKR